MKKCKVIGLTGGVGSGKSAVAAMFARLGASVFDADKLCHDLLDRPAVARRVRAYFGDEIIGRGGRLDRRAIAEKVFTDGAALARLMAILHPEVIRQLKASAALLRLTGARKALVIDAALLTETGLEKICDALVFVDAPLSVRAARAGRKRGWTAGEIKRREKFQLPLNKKRQKADYVIDNTRTRRQTLTQVKDIWRSLIERNSLTGSNYIINPTMHST
jgi:dephospho-CoA kinase